MSNLKLSKRLLCVASNVKSGGVVADIGCDHGFTSIYLVQNKIAEGAVALDINRGPLERAKQHISEYGMENYISVRLSDGARELKHGEADTLLISGMGGALMVKILKDGIDVVKEAKELVLSPQSEIYLVRHFLHENGFKIEHEDMVKDQGKFYVVIRAIHGSECYGSEEGYIYGDYLINNRNEGLKQFLIKEQKRISSILSGISKYIVSDDAESRKKSLEEEYNSIKSILAKMESQCEVQ